MSHGPKYTAYMAADGNLDNAWTAALKWLPDHFCAKCHSCQLRRSTMELWTVDEEGFAFRIDESYTDYNKRDIYLLEHNYKLLVVFFEDSTFLVSPVNILIKSSEVPEIDLFSRKLASIDCHNAQLYLVTSSLSVTPFSPDEQPLKDYFWEQRGSEWSCRNRKGDKLLLKSRALVIPLDSRTTAEKYLELKAKKMFKERKQKMVIKEIEKNQVKKWAKQTSNATDAVDTLNDWSKTSIARQKSKLTKPCNINIPKESRSQNTVPFDYNSDDDILSDSTSSESGTISQGNKTVNETTAKRRSTSESNAPIRRGALRRKYGRRSTVPEIHRTDKCHTSLSGDHSGCLGNEQDEQNERQNISDNVDIRVVGGTFTDEREAVFENEKNDGKNEQSGIKQQDVEHDLSCIRNDGSSDKPTLSATSSLTLHGTFSSSPPAAASLSSSLTSSSASVSESSSSKSAAAAAMSKSPSLPSHGTSSSASQPSSTSSTTSKNEENLPSNHSRTIDNSLQNLSIKYAVPEQCESSKIDRSVQNDDNDGKITPMEQECISNSENKNNCTTKLSNSTGESEKLAFEPGQDGDSGDSSTHVSNSGPTTGESNIHLKTARHSCDYYAVASPQVLKPILDQYKRIKKGEVEVNCVHPPHKLCLSTIHLVHSNHHWIIENEEDISSDCEDENCEVYSLQSDIKVLFYPSTRIWSIHHVHKDEADAHSGDEESSRVTDNNTESSNVDVLLLSRNSDLPQLAMLDNAIQKIFYQVAQAEGLDDTKYPDLRRVICVDFCSALYSLLNHGLKKRKTLFGSTRYTLWEVIAACTTTPEHTALAQKINKLGQLETKTCLELLVCEFLNTGSDALAVWLESFQKQDLTLFYEDSAMMRKLKGDILVQKLSRLSFLPFRLTYFDEIQKQLKERRQQQAFIFE